MKKIIREVDAERGIHQITIADERWYMKPVNDPITGVPSFKAVPSVTWITQSYPKGIAYFKWLADKGWDEAEAIKIQAGDKGTKVHLAIEQVLYGKEVRIDSKFLNKSTGNEEELTPDECDAILSFIAWKAEMEKTWIIETIAIERTVYSDRHDYAGTIDWAFKLTLRSDPSVVEYWILDFKTSQSVWPSHELQLNAYKGTLMNGENVVEGLVTTNLRMAVLQVGYRKNKAQYKLTMIEDDFDMFLTTQKIWRREHGDEKPSKRDYPIILSPEVVKEVVAVEVPNVPALVVKDIGVGTSEIKKPAKQPKK